MSDDAHTMAAIIAATCACAGVSRRELLARRMAMSADRQIAMLLARRMTKLSLPAIGRALADRDHSTICYGARRMARLAAADPAMRARIAHVAAFARLALFAGRIGEAIDGPRDEVRRELASIGAGTVEAQRARVAA